MYEVTHRGRGREAEFLQFNTWFISMENRFIWLKVKKSGIDNEYKYKSATDQGNGTATSRRPAIIPLNDGQVRICLYVSLALCDPIPITINYRICHDI